VTTLNTNFIRYLGLMKKILLPTLVLLLVISACTGKRKLKSLKGEYQITRILENGTELEFKQQTSTYDGSLTDYSLTIELMETGDIDVNAPVNGCGGIFVLSGKNRISIEDLACTQMWGMDSMANVWESKYVNALMSINVYELDDTSLNLSTIGGADSLYYNLEFSRVE